jgi:hypothetical protein
VVALRVEDLGLTPSQLAEVRDADKAQVGAWLEALASTPGLRSPAGWFLAGVRSGNRPNTFSDGVRAQAVHNAERFMINAGRDLPSEAEVLDELFGRHGVLRHWQDAELTARMVALWHEQRAVPWPARLQA